MISLASVLFAGLALSASPAEVEDVYQLDRGDHGQIFIALSDVPTSFQVTQSDQALVIEAAQFDARDRTIRPARGAVFDALHVVSNAGSTRITLEGVGDVARVRPVVGGLLVDLGQGQAPIVNAVPEERRIVASAAIQRSLPSSGVANQTAAADSADTSRTSTGETSSDRTSTANTESSGPANLASTSTGAARSANADQVLTVGTSTQPAEVAAETLDSQPETAMALTPCATHQASLDDSPWDLELLTVMGECLAGQNADREAAEYFERVLAFEPEHFRAALGLARLREGEGNRNEAARLFEVASRSAMTDGEALAARAAARRVRDDDDAGSQR